MINAVKQFFLDLQLSIWMALHGARVRLAEERGDTNFISIAIVLVIIITVAIVFIGFRNTVVGWFNDAIDNLGKALNP